MNPLLSLRREHQLLTGLTNALDAFGQTLRRSGRFVQQEIRDFARSFSVFADSLHYEKEEQILVPFLVHHGFDYNGPLLLEVREEHSLHRSLIEFLSHAGQRRGSLGKFDQQRLCSTIATLANGQRQLAQKQEAELFPTIATRLAPDTLQHLLLELKRFDHHHVDTLVEMRSLIHSLSMRHRESRAARSPTA